MQANSDHMSNNTVHTTAEILVTDLRNKSNDESHPPCMLAWRVGFREVVQILRPDIPMALAITQCLEFGEGMNAEQVHCCIMKPGCNTCRVETTLCEAVAH